MKLRTARCLIGLLLGLYALGSIIPDSDAQTVTILYSFGVNPNDGTGPVAGLVQGTDGNFYGTTSTGGSNTLDYGPTYGTVFQINPSGTYTTLYRFAGYPNDGANPRAGLMHGSDGNFYGTTTYGGGVYGDFLGYYGNGTVFRISPSGNYTNLYSFAGYPDDDGAYPSAGLVQGGDGNFYGTTSFGGGYGYYFGVFGNGTVFRISPSGTETNLYPIGGYPQAGLLQGSDGNFYGTTGNSVFRISPSGVETNLHFFNYQPHPEVHPYIGLVQGNDGNFYGTTQFGGLNGQNYGTVFRISPNGNYTNLYSFGNFVGDGIDPCAALVQGSDGSFYGTTYGGGTAHTGTVFKLTIPLNPPANQISAIQFFSLFDSMGVGALIPSVAGETYQLQYTDSLSPTNWINTGESAISIGGPMILIDLAGALPQQRFYRAVITP